MSSSLKIIKEFIREHKIAIRFYNGKNLNEQDPQYNENQVKKLKTGIRYLIEEIGSNPCLVLVHYDFKGRSPKQNFTSYFIGEVPFKGWAPIMILLLVLSGMQMLMLGILGEYLWRTLDQVRKRPPYIIEKIVT